jgi:hypothetical protein
MEGIPNASVQALEVIKSSGRAGWSEVVIVVGKSPMLGQCEPELPLVPERRSSCLHHGCDTDGVATYRGEVRRVGNRDATGAAGGAVGGHLACAQGHQRSGVNTVGRSVGTTGRAGRVRAAVGVLGHGSGKVRSGDAQTGRR